MKLGEICLCTDNVPRLAAFYRWLLCVEGENTDDPVHQFVLSCEPMLTVYNDGSKKSVGDSIQLAFTVENVDAEAARLEEKGIALRTPPVTQPWGARNLSFFVPDGNLVFLRQLPPA